jgi:hypothetical protein
MAILFYRPGCFLTQLLSLAKMLPATIFSIALAFAGSATAQGAPGYFTGFSSVPSNTTISFGKNYAVLNLDLINGLVGSVASTPQGAAWINSTATWIDAVHAQNPPPLSIFTRITSVNALNPDVAGGFMQAFAGLAPGTANETATMIYPAFTPSGHDVVLSKIRYYAGTANPLELILSSQKIDTVVLVRKSGSSNFQLLMDWCSLVSGLLVSSSAQSTDFSISTTMFMSLETVSSPKSPFDLQ